MKNYLIIILLASTVFGCSPDSDKGPKNISVDVSNIDAYVDQMALLNNKLKKRPNDISLLLQSANLALDNYDYSKALADAAKAFRLDSNNVDTKLVYALTIINQSNRSVADIRRAQRYFQSIIKVLPDDPKAMIGLANTYVLQQDFEEARDWIDKTLAISPKFFDAHVLKGSIYKVLSAALTGDEGSETLSRAYMDSAIQTYARVSQYYPDRPETYVQLGILYQQSGNKSCIDQFYSAVQLSPGNLDYMYALAYAYSLFNQERRAMIVYQEMQDLDSSYSEAYCQMGQIYQKKYNELDSALFMYREVISIDPNHVDAYVNMGVIYEAQKQNTNALRSYAKALAIQPEDRSPFMSLNDFTMNQGLARAYADELKTKL